MFDLEEPYYEPTQADLIFLEAFEKLKGSLKDSVKSHVESFIKENQRLEKENKKLRNREKEIGLKMQEAEQLVKEAKRKGLSELMGEREMIMYKADYNYNHGEKCSKCDDNRNVLFKSPGGKPMKETCDCYKNIQEYYSSEYICHEMRKNRNDSKLTMWFKRYSEDDGDGYSSGNAIYDKDIYNGEDFSTFKPYDKIFKFKDDCDKYCEYLNRLEE